MRFILFCQNAYAFGIMAPIRDALIAQGEEFLWYLPNKLLSKFSFLNDPHTASILDLQFFKSDVIFVPGNEVPYYLRGVKTQIFHGLAGEKKGHFRIRHYFDLYLTQGPFFTEKFRELSKKHKNFDVIETGWPKLDIYGQKKDQYQKEKTELLEKHSAEKIILYAPTFSPRLTSAGELIEDIEQLASNSNFILVIKFHDLMHKKWINAYKNLAKRHDNILFKEEKNIVKFLILADILISDTSSVIYEFLLLNKPAITFKTISNHIRWDDLKQKGKLTESVVNNLENDNYSQQRSNLNQLFHPYKDGKSAERMINAVKQYVAEKGVPENRQLQLTRKVKIDAIFNKPIEKIWNGIKKNKISAIFITLNEIENINEVLTNVQFADEILVVDSISTDGTIEQIEKRDNVKLIKRPFVNYTDQKTFALSQVTNDWVLFMDADERLTDDLKNEILTTVNGDNPADAYNCYRKFMFQNKILRFSGWQSDKNFRLFRKSKVSFNKDRIVHETLIVDGEIGELKNKLVHYSYRNYEDYKAKMVKYGQMKAREELSKNYAPNLLHFMFRPAYKFFNHYVLRLGFLDGKKGIIICYLNALGVFSRYKELKRLRQQDID